MTLKISFILISLTCFLNLAKFTNAGVTQCCNPDEVFNSKIPNDLKTLGPLEDVCVKSDPDAPEDLQLNTCTKRYVLNNLKHFQFRITNEETAQFLMVYQFYKSIWITVPPDQFCVGNVNDDLSKLDNSSVESIENINQTIPNVLIFCEFEDYRSFQASSVLYGVSRFISGLNLLIVLTIYVINWKSHKVIGYLTCCYLFSLTCHCVWMGSLFLVGLDWFQPRGELPICQISVQISRYLSFVLLFTAFEFNLFMFMTFWKMNYKLKPPGKDFGIVPKFFLASWLIPAIVFALDYAFGYYFGASHPWIYRSYSDTNHHSIQPYTILLLYSIMLCNFAAIFLIIASGIIIVYLRTSSKVTKVSYSESVTLFVRLILGSGFFLLCYTLADYASRESDTSTKWKYWNILYCVIAVANSFYVLIVFGFTGDNFSLFTEKVKSALRASRQFH